MKKLLSIILASLLTSGTVLAAPSTVPSIDTTSESATYDFANDVISGDDVSQDTTDGEKSLVTAALVAESTGEPETYEAPSNAASSDSAILMFDNIYAGGDGTKENPYLIHNKIALSYFSSMVNSGYDTTSYYELSADIDLDGAEWTPVGYFNNDVGYNCSFGGHFDGKGYTISNFKITKSNTPYVGFFGLIFNGSVKNLNLDGVTIDVERFENDAKAVYVGAVVGRFITEGIGGQGEISGCHVTNTTITVKSDKDAYVAGISGFALAGKNTSYDVYDVSSDCDVYVSVNSTEYANSNTNPPKCYNAFGASLFAYFGALSNSTVSLRNATAYGNVNVDTSLSDKVYNFSGGIFAQMATRVSSEGEVGGTAYITGCASHVYVTANGKRPVFSGGFAGNIGATENLKLFNCYSSGDVYSCTTAASPSAGWLSIGGFVGQLDYGVYADSMGKSIYNCYSSGNVVDTYYETGNVVDSWGGGFVGFSFAPVFRNCYNLASKRVSSPNLTTDSGITIVSSDKESDISGYPALDFNTVWQIDSSTEYPYPTLKENLGYVLFLVDGKYFNEAVIDADGKIAYPAANPQKQSNVEWEYTFSHWSLTPNGEAFDAINDTVTSGTELHAVFSYNKKKYTVTFMSEGEVFDTPQSVEYGSSPVAPSSVPKKDETSKYRYQFHHWSRTVGGAEQKLSEISVTGNITLYAVFTEINKTAWEGEVADSFSEGYGTKSLPYVITSSEEFALMAKVINEGTKEYADAYFALGDDIHLGYYTWTPIGTADNPFRAHFDGAGYSVSCYSIEPCQYMGLFGYVKSGEIRNLYISDFEIILDDYSMSGNLYIGGLAGYIESKSQKNSVIDNISINGEKFDVTVSADILYAGGLAGYATSDYAKTLITNCFVTNDITAVNTLENSRTYAGGIIGYMYTFADGSLTKASSAYYVGSVDAYGKNRCSAGGLAGSVFSYGSAYIPPVIMEEGDILNESTDHDIMLENCFVIANVDASSDSILTTNTMAGAVTGEVSQYAAVNNVFFQRSTRVTSTGNVAVYGMSSSANNLTSKDFIEKTVGFDFVNVWTYVGDGQYPVLKTMYSDKPILRINNLDFEDGVLSASITAFAKSSDYTVMVGVYNERNQLVASRRQRFSASATANEFVITVNGVSSVYKIKVSAYDSLTFIPLFSALEWYL